MPNMHSIRITLKLTKKLPQYMIIGLLIVILLVCVRSSQHSLFLILNFFISSKICSQFGWAGCQENNYDISALWSIFKTRPSQSGGKLSSLMIYENPSWNYSRDDALHRHDLDWIMIFFHYLIVTQKSVAML